MGFIHEGGDIDWARAHDEGEGISRRLIGRRACGMENPAALRALNSMLARIPLEAPTGKLCPKCGKRVPVKAKDLERELGRVTLKRNYPSLAGTLDSTPRRRRARRFHRRAEGLRTAAVSALTEREPRGLVRSYRATKHRMHDALYREAGFPIASGAAKDEKRVAR